MCWGWSDGLLSRPFQVLWFLLFAELIRLSSPHSPGAVKVLFQEPAIFSLVSSVVGQEGNPGTDDLNALQTPP